MEQPLDFRGLRKGMRAQGDQHQRFQKPRQNYHGADHNGRMYLCGCIGAFRVGDRLKWGVNGKRNKTPDHHKGSRFYRMRVVRKDWR